jgi:hypothetical protein
MRCSFCATGRMGFRRNLSAAEIVNQVLALEELFDRRATNVVFMGRAAARSCRTHYDTNEQRRAAPISADRK